MSTDNLVLCSILPAPDTKVAETFHACELDPVPATGLNYENNHNTAFISMNNLLHCKDSEMRLIEIYLADTAFANNLKSEKETSRVPRLAR